MEGYFNDFGQCTGEKSSLSGHHHICIIVECFDIANSLRPFDQ